MYTIEVVRQLVINHKTVRNNGRILLYYSRWQFWIPELGISEPRIAEPSWTAHPKVAGSNPTNWQRGDFSLSLCGKTRRNFTINTEYTRVTIFPQSLHLYILNPVVWKEPALGTELAKSLYWKHIMQLNEEVEAQILNVSILLNSFQFNLIGCCHFLTNVKLTADYNLHYNLSL